MCCKGKSPLFYSLLIPLTLILIFVYFCSQRSCLLLLPAAGVMVLWWLLVYSLFPKIVVTIEDTKDIEKFTSLKLYVDGRCVYNADNAKAEGGTAGVGANTNAEDDAEDWPPAQFTFHVWKRGIYQLLLVSDTNESAIESANTYEHAVCNVVFGNNAKGN